jgi:Mrp family chromosome partitioning ATPase
LNIAATDGIAEFLTGEKPLSDVMHATDDKRLSVIPCGTALSNPLKTLNSSSTKIKELMDLAKPAYDIIILDTCSVEDGSEPLLLSAVADKIIYVLASQGVSARRAQNAISALRRSNPEKIGIVLNKVREINLY